MKRFSMIAALVVAAIAVSSAQQNTDRVRALPGDRPAANTHATRSAVFGRNGMIATSQPLASAAGLKVLQDGGNAIDAAVTAAAVLAVVEPSMTGIGGDLFAIVYDAKTKTLHALNASGRSAYAATPQEYAKRGQTRMPGTGVLSVTVPGVVEGWSELLSKYGTLPMAKVGRAGDRLREERLRGLRDHQRPVEGEREEARRRSGDGGDVPAQRPSAAAGRDLREPASRRDARGDRQGRPRRVLQGPDRARDRRRHEEARRPARRARLRRAQGRLGRADFDDLPRLRRLRDAAEHAGVRRPRDAEHPRGLRHQGDGPQLARGAARADRGEADRVRRSRRLRRRSAHRCRRRC